jgi:hypothetical protein
MKKFMAGILLTLTQLAYAAEENCPDLTTLQRWAGYLDWTNFLYALGIVMVTIGVIFFTHGFIKWAWDTVWFFIRGFVDVIAFAVSIGLVVYGSWVPEEYRLTPVMSGSILFAASIMLMVWLRKIETESPTGFFALLTIVWGAIAIYYNMSEIGFLAVAALMGVLGFSVAVNPLCYSFGFKDEKSVDAGTAAALMILATYVIAKIFYPNMPQAMAVFAPGTFWLGSLVGYIGLLILSNKWFVEAMDGNYAWMQIVTISFCIAGIALGMTFGINPLAGIAGTIGVLYFAAKLIEIPTEDSMLFGMKLILIGGFFYGAWFVAKSNEALIKTYITSTLPV